MDQNDSMLNLISEKLQNLNMGPIQYGRVTSQPEIWNYIVYGRARMRRTGTSKNDFNRYYSVVIVHEDYIPEGCELQVIKALEEIKGLKLSQEDIEYDYTVKKNSGIVVEMAVIIFTEPIKGYTI